MIVSVPFGTLPTSIRGAPRPQPFSGLEFINATNTVIRQISKKGRPRTVLEQAELICAEMADNSFRS
jgi:hypothetical protein